MNPVQEEEVSNFGRREEAGKSRGWKVVVEGLKGFKEVEGERFSFWVSFLKVAVSKVEGTNRGEATDCLR